MKCVVCQNENDSSYHLYEGSGVREMLCSKCIDIQPKPLDTSFSERSKKKVEEERKRKNAEILASMSKRKKPKR